MSECELHLLQKDQNNVFVKMGALATIKVITFVNCPQTVPSTIFIPSKSLLAVV